MARVCEELARRGVELRHARTLEFFAREGDWQAVVYAGRVASPEAWEIDPRFEPGLRARLPHATVRIVDSIRFAVRPENQGRFDFVVIDNPQGCFGPSGQYCEHFEALETVGGLLPGAGVVVFNVNRAPFDFERQPVWQARRSAYYGLPDTSHLSPDFLLAFYRELFGRCRLATAFGFEVRRNAEYLSYLVFGLEHASGREA